MKKFDCSLTMAEDIITVDSLTFEDITISKQALCDRFENIESYELYVSYINDKPIGFIGLMKAITPHYNGWWIDLLAVIPEKQNKGIGSKLISFAKEQYKTENNIITALIRKNNSSSIKAAKNNGFDAVKNVDFNLFILE